MGLFGLAFSTCCVVIPDCIWVFLDLHFDALLTNRADYHIDAVVVGGERALVIVCPRVPRAEDLLAAVTLER